MAKEVEETEAQETEAKKGGKNPMMIIIIAAVGALLLAVVAFVIVFKVIAAKPNDGEEKPKKEETKEVAYGKLFSFDEPIIVNLAETKGQRYLKVNLQFEVPDDKVLDELGARTPVLLDLVIGILSSKTIEDVSHTVGRNRLRREIIDKTNSELVSGRVMNVYFTEFVIQ